MKLQFLGTGAADWAGPDKNGECRRFTSTLIDDSLLIDVNPDVLPMIERDKLQSVIFTHSHRDHFNLDALRALAPVKVYAHESWAGEIQGEGLDVIPLKIGQEVILPSGHAILPMPANHSTEKKYETPLHYLVSKDDKNLLYATDGAWLMNQEHHLIGKRTLQAAVFDATIGDGFPGDYRVFEHNSIDMVRLMLQTLHRTGRLEENAPVFLTHMARTLHGSQAEIESKLEKPLIACYDGFTAEV